MTTYDAGMVPAWRSVLRWMNIPCISEVPLQARTCNDQQLQMLQKLWLEISKIQKKRPSIKPHCHIISIGNSKWWTIITTASQALPVVHPQSVSTSSPQSFRGPQNVYWASVGRFFLGTSWYFIQVIYHFNSFHNIANKCKIYGLHVVGKIGQQQHFCHAVLSAAPESPKIVWYKMKETPCETPPLFWKIWHPQLFVA